MKLIFAFALLAAPLTTFADDVAQAGGFQVHQFATRSSSIGTEDADFIELAPLSSSTTVRQHRYQVLSTGQIGDFSAVNFKQVQAHTYFVFPQSKDIHFDTNTPGSVKVVSSSGLILTYKNGGLDKISDAEGGSPCTFAKPFTITSCQNRLVFDTGVGTSNGAYANLKGTTKVTDPDGHSCTVSNGALFEYIPGRKTKDDVQTKSMSAIAKALKSEPACAQVDAGILQGGSARTKPASSSRLDSVDAWLKTLPASKSKSIR